MTEPIRRIVDAHVHLWDPARTDWYPYLTDSQELNMGDTSGMSRKFDLATYQAESSKWPIEKFVHVAAAAAPFLADETAELEQLGSTTGQPVAIVGGVVPTVPMRDIEDLLDRQMESSRFRGVRVLGQGDPVPFREMLKALQARNLVLDFMGHTNDLELAGKHFAEWPGLSIVVEHMGWPHSASEEEFQTWKRGMSALASAGQHVSCKLSGLAMPLSSMAPEVFRKWILYCIEAFGVDRCMFASNFPVDGMHGTFDDLYGTYDTLTADCTPAERDQLFAATAERVYRC